MSEEEKGQTLEDDGDKVVVVPLYGWLFGAWTFAWLVVEFFLNIGYLPKEASWAFPVLLFVFLPLELHGAKTSKLGDTYSESVWGFIQKKPARKIVGAALALALAFRAATFPYLLEGTENIFIRDLPWWAISTGLFGWLVQHFPESGKRG